MTVFVKRADASVVEVVDVTPYIDGLTPDEYSFAVRGEAGITVDGDFNEAAGTVTLTVTGGDVGRLYRFGLDINTSSGTVKVLSHLLRVRDMTRWDEVPIVETIGEPASGLVFLVNADGELLITAADEALHV